MRQINAAPQQYVLGSSGLQEVSSSARPVFPEIRVVGRQAIAAKNLTVTSFRIKSDVSYNPEIARWNVCLQCGDSSHVA